MAVQPAFGGFGDTNSAPAATGEENIDARKLRLFVMILFFIFGGNTSLNDVIIPKLKEIFTLNYTQAMLVQFCFFTAYLLIGIPAAKLVKRIGYMRGAAVGLLTMMVGCLLFIPASQTATYSLFLLALFVLASGIVIVQVVANPLISLLGKPETAHSRLTFAQAFNSLGTTIFPIAGSMLILGSLAKISADQLSGTELDAYRTAESQAIVHGYLGIAVALAVVAGAVWLFRNHLQGERHEASTGLAGFDLLKRPRFGFGALCIFLYVGAEVSIGSLIVSYLMQGHVMGLQEQAAGKLIGLYWGGAMLGRFIGSAVMRVVSPGIRMHQSSRETILSILGGSSGVSIVCEGSTGARYPDVVYHPIHGEQGPALTGYSGCWRDDNGNPALRRFLGFTKDRYALSFDFMPRIQ